MFDGLFDYTDGHFRGRCHLTIFTPEGGHTTVLLTEIDHPGGRTVTNAIEAIASLVVHTFSLDPQQVQFLQHVPRENRYFVVDFRWESGPDGEPMATAPEWHPFTPTEAIIKRGNKPSA
jgi:hypothetical protein